MSATVSAPRHSAESSTAQSIEALCKEAHLTGLALVADLTDDGIWIDTLERSPAAQKGTGRAFIERMKTLASATHCPVRLAVWAENESLRAYYHSLGFEIEYEPPAEDLDGSHDHAILVWKSPTAH